MNNIETISSVGAMKLAMEALETLNSGDTYKTHNAATALRQAINAAEQREQAQQDVDWEKLYRLEVKKKEAIAAKYEQDIKPLTKIVPMAQPAEPVVGVFDYKEHAEGLQRDYDLLLAEYNDLKAQQAEPVAYIRVSKTGHVMACAKTGDFFSLPHKTLLYTSPPQRQWVGLTDKEVEKIIKANMSLQMNLAGIRADFESAYGIKGEA